MVEVSGISSRSILACAEAAEISRPKVGSISAEIGDFGQTKELGVTMKAIRRTGWNLERKRNKFLVLRFCLVTLSRTVDFFFLLFHIVDMRW